MELRKVAHRARMRLGGNPTMQTTAVVNEAYLKLRGAQSDIDNRVHFLRIAARAMRQIIIDYARGQNAEKRGGDGIQVTLDEFSGAVDVQVEQLLSIDEALDKLYMQNERLAEVFTFKFFVGLEDGELAEAVGSSKRTVQRDWMKARAYLAEIITDID